MRDLLADPAKLLGVMVVVAALGAAALSMWWQRYRSGPVELTELEWQRAYEPNLENVKHPPPTPEDWRDWKPE